MKITYMNKGQTFTVHNVDKVEDSGSNYTLRMQFSDTPIVIPITRKLTIER